MKISYNWLKQYVDFNLTPGDLAEVLTGVGLEVEEISLFESLPGGLDGVVIGEVKDCTKHPDADKLSVTKVDIGAEEYLQIVCGAPNVAVGQKVIVALVGSTLYPLGGEKLLIKKAKIRGIESFGMICAEDELGLGESHAGILILPPSVTAGTKAADFFKVEKDNVLEIGLTPNRSDANSHIGVARDLAAALNISYHTKVVFNKPEVRLPTVRLTQSSKISIDVIEAEACPRYSGISISNVTISDSPDWLKNRLKAIGVKPLNNIVDITNYVLHEYGQPLHAFDADKISGGKVTVKKLKEGTVFKTLDDKEIRLSHEDLMICDERGGMCIAGVYGGKETGITSSTVNIFLESAYFTATGIRRTSSRHQLRTDAATHYEKGCDPNSTIIALQRAAALICEICGGSIASEIMDVYPKPITEAQIDVSYDRICRLSGFSIPKETVYAILRHLEIKIEREEGDTLRLSIPTFKTDVKREADIVEEVLRIYGYNSFALPKQLKSNLSYTPIVNTVKLENVVAGLLTGAGLNEIWTNSVSQSKFETEKELQKQQVKLLNSQTAELDSLRTSMLYSGLEVISYNQNRKQPFMRLFEFGSTYHWLNSSYNQQNHIALWFTGNTFEDNWVGKSEPYNYYHLKSIVMQVLNRLGHYHFEREYFESDPFSFALLLKNEGETIAQLGAVSEKTLRTFDIKQAVYYAELNRDYLWEKSQFQKVTFRELPKYPTVKRDLAMIVAEDLPFEVIEKAAFAESKKLLREISLFDVYKGEKIEKGKKSYAISLLFQHPDKTLTDPEIEKVMNRLMRRYETELGASIRKN